MNKFFSKILTGILAASGFMFFASGALAEIRGRDLSADLGAADLLGIASSHSNIFWSALIIFVIVCVGYGMYYLFKKKTN